MANLWSGRFEKGMDKIVEEFNASIFIDKRLYECDVEGSIAHVTMLCEQGVVTTDEKNKIIAELINIKEEKGTLEDILKRELHLDNVKLIKCGGNSVIDAAREQWNDGSNTLCIAPGEVIVYSRNYVTNETLQQEGINVHIMPSSELSRGRGGPRCMSMPLIREDL